MEKYGQDWNQWHSQPSWVIELAKEKYKIEAKQAAHAAKQNG